MGNRPTNIRMPEQTYRQIEHLQEWGFGNTKAAIVTLAVDRLYETARRRLESEDADDAGEAAGQA